MGATRFAISSNTLDLALYGFLGVPPDIIISISAISGYGEGQFRRSDDTGVSVVKIHSTSFLFPLV